MTMVRSRRSWVGIVAALLFLAACSSDPDDSSTTTSAPEADGSGGGETDPSATTLTLNEVEASIPELDAIVESAMERTGVPGVAVAVVFDDEVIYTEGYGVRDVDGSNPVEPETIFEVASMSKPISSTIMAGAVGEGVFGWDDPVVAYNPDFALSDPLVTEAVTFADLFAHRSGIPGGGGDVLESIGYDRAEILFRLRYLPLNPFRITYAYSNFAMTAGGESAAVAAGMSWEDLADQMLFEPAGMTSTSMRYSNYDEAENRAELHVQTDDGWASDFGRVPVAQAPAGGVSSNVVDLAQWVRLQINGGELDGVQVIDEEALDETHTPQVLKSPPTPTIAGQSNFYGLGWNIETDATGATRWNHSGAFSTGASTTVKILPAEGLGIVVLTNGAPIGVPEAISDSYFDHLQTGEWSEETLDVWVERFSGLYGEPEYEGEPPADPAPALENSAYVGTYTNDFVGDVEVVENDGGGLSIIEGPAEVTYELTHWDANIFVYPHDPELPEFLSGVSFEIGEDGTAQRVTLGAFDTEGQGTLQRVG